MSRIISDRDQLGEQVARLRAEGRTIVLANGAFDILHVGHIRYLRGAAAEGDVLVVAVNTDESIKRYKDANRPLQPLDERLEILDALACIDILTAFEEPTCDALLELIRPDVHAKGPEYTPDTLPEYPTLQRLGIRMATVGDPKTHSSTELIRRLNR